MIYYIEKRYVLTKKLCTCLEVTPLVYPTVLFSYLWAILQLYKLSVTNSSVRSFLSTDMQMMSCRHSIVFPYTLLKNWFCPHLYKDIHFWYCWSINLSHFQFFKNKLSSLPGSFMSQQKSLTCYNNLYICMRKINLLFFENYL